MSEYGLKIKNIKAGTLFGYNQGIRDRYDYTDAMFSNSLFSDYIRENGMNVWKEKSTRDIICLDFDFGSRSYEEEKEHLEEMIKTLKQDGASEDSIQKITDILDKVNQQELQYEKLSKEEIRVLFYENGVNVEYITRDKDGNITKSQTITYVMLYRSSAKAKIGQVMFINKKLYKKAYNWLTMGIGKKMKKDNAKIVELSAYAPLTTSTIINKLHIPVENILILKDQDSFFQTCAKVVKSEDYTKEIKVLDEEKTQKNKQTAIDKEQYREDGSLKFKRAFRKENISLKKCIVDDEEIEVKNTLWDGMALIESSILPSWVHGMVLLRHHFFKACAFRSNLQLFFKDWCDENGHDYETYEVFDMFGNLHKLKDIKMITTDNAIKWKKFTEYMGNTLKDAHQYWCKWVNDNGSMFGVVKTDHPSKLGDVQQMSYQMINTLPCDKEDIKELAKNSVEYVESLKLDNDAFERFLRKNATEVNHYEMLADLYQHNKDFANSTWFREEKKKIINVYVEKLRGGKITINADNLTLCGNPYALLLYTVGEDWKSDPTLNYEKGVIQCYTTRFDDNEYLCGIRNPHNSPNNICYLHNVYSEQMTKYFPFSKNILAVNCIQSDVQDRANGCDFDSDFFFTTNHPVMVKCARKAYEEYPTIVNKLKESGITYENTMLAYAEMDNKFAKSRLGIGESSNLAQLAMTYYWTQESKDLYDNFVILSVLAQVIIDGCKREYEVDGVTEIERIKKLDCMQRSKTITDKKGKTKKVLCDYPLFMKYTKDIQYTKNGKERPYEEIKEEKDRLRKRIDRSLVCPMNWLQEVLDGIISTASTTTTPTEKFFIKVLGRTDSRKLSKIRELVEEYAKFEKHWLQVNEDEEDANFSELCDYFNNVIKECEKITSTNAITMNRLIETALGIDKVGNRYSISGKQTNYTRKILNILYRVNKDKFLNNFVKK